MPKKTLEGIKIVAPRMMKLAEILLSPYNPRTITPEKMASLKASLIKHGLVLNLVVQASTKILIAGHQRIRAMHELCAEKGWAVPEEVPVTLLDVDDSTAKQLNVALNNIEGEFDPYKLGELFKDIRPSMSVDDVLATGFRLDEIDETIKLVTGTEESPPPEATGFASAITLSVAFKTAKERDEAKAILKETSASGLDPGRVFLRALKAAKVAGKTTKGAINPSSNEKRRRSVA